MYLCSFLVFRFCTMPILLFLERAYLQAPKTPGTPVAATSGAEPPDLMTPDSSAPADLQELTEQPKDQTLRNQLDALKGEIEALKNGTKQHEAMRRQVTRIHIGDNDFSALYRSRMASVVGHISGVIAYLLASVVCRCRYTSCVRESYCGGFSDLIEIVYKCISRGKFSVNCSGGINVAGRSQSC